MYCLAKIRNSHLKTQIKDKCSDDEFHFGYTLSYFSKIYNCLELNNYEYTLAAKVFKGQLSTST